MVEKMQERIFSDRHIEEWTLKLKENYTLNHFKLLIFYSFSTELNLMYYY